MANKQTVLKDIEKECNTSRTFKFNDWQDDNGVRHITAPQVMIDHNIKLGFWKEEDDCFCGKKH